MIPPLGTADKNVGGNKKRGKTGYISGGCKSEIFLFKFRGLNPSGNSNNLRQHLKVKFEEKSWLLLMKLFFLKLKVGDDSRNV